MSNRGTAYSGLGDRRLAEKDYDAAIKLDGRFLEAYVNRAMTRRERGELKKALQDCEAALRVDSTYARAYIERAQVHLRSDRIKDALRDCETAIYWNRRTPEAFSVRGGIRYERGDYAGALADFDQAVALGASPHTLSARAWLRASCPEATLRNADDPIADAKRACELRHWRQEHPLQTLAMGYAEKADFEAAVKHQRQALELIRDAERRQRARKRLALYERRKPFRDIPPNDPQPEAAPPQQFRFPNGRSSS
ncbi:MAG TPA: tetratricopeptide repeat protein [Chthoniobacterales bacterium]|nr:tetratricopeptide repeat protein [Chthoniobacterales bacterium]